MKSLQSEKERLDQISEASLYAFGIMPRAISHCFNIMTRFLVGENILEMGPAEGVMTEKLISTGKNLTLVEGAQVFCEDLSNRFPQAKVIHALFEEYVPDQKFDNIILGHVLEHVEEPIAILKQSKHWLKDESSRIFAAVPNAHSLHRQAAVTMGLLPTANALNKLDIRHGHRRVFDPASFKDIFCQSGLKIDVFGGYWMKPVSNSQIEETWTEEMLDAFMHLGEQYPDIAGEIYIVASLPGDEQ